MSRSKKLPVITRRDFCAIGGCAVGMAALAGCTDGVGGVVTTGPLGAGPDARQSQPGDPDAGPPGTPDARPSNPDAMISPPDAPPGGPACTGSATDVGAPSSYSSGGTPKLYSSGRFFVVRDAGGLYAVSSICTHEGAQNGVSSGHFRCPRHGATFTYNGDIISGPVSRGLVHYAMCILSNGNAGVMTGQQANQSDRLAV